MRVEYPIALDSDFGVWSAFGNWYWPAVYLVDAVGRIRYHHFGEGELVREPGPMTDRTFEVAFLDPGVEVYVFTFG